MTTNTSSFSFETWPRYIEGDNEILVVAEGNDGEIARTSSTLTVHFRGLPNEPLGILHLNGSIQVIVPPGAELQRSSDLINWETIPGPFEQGHGFNYYLIPTDSATSQMFRARF